MEPGELLQLDDIELLPDILMMMDGTALRDMLPPVKRKYTKSWAFQTRRNIGGVGRSGGTPVHDRTFDEPEIRENPLLALSPEELLTLRLYMQGKGTVWIARHLGMTDMGVRFRLQRPHVQEAKRYITAGHDEDMVALYGKVVNDLAEGMEDADKEFRLKVGDRILKAIGKDGSGGRNKKDSDEMGGVEEMLSVILEKAEQAMGTSGQVEARKSTVKIDYKKRLQLPEEG